MIVSSSLELTRQRPLTMRRRSARYIQLRTQKSRHERGCARSLVRILFHFHCSVRLYHSRLSCLRIRIRHECRRPAMRGPCYGRLFVMLHVVMLSAADGLFEVLLSIVLASTKSHLAEVLTRPIRQMHGRTSHSPRYSRI